MQTLIALLKLMRFDKPIGILLLLWPTYWALWISASDKPSLLIFTLFTLGVIVMRAAGCVINDIADRKFDKHVARTKLRPLAQGDLKLSTALMALAGLFSVALGIALQLNQQCLYLAIGGALITVIYPFCKRFIKAPQMVLGFAFAWGIPMAYCAQNHSIDGVFVLLMVITYAWIVMYDTMYAMADKADDIKIGVNSTAIMFGSSDKFILLMLQLLIQSLWLVLITKLKLSSWAYLFWCVATLIFTYQQWLIKDRQPLLCIKAFLNNHWYGFCYWLCLVITLH